MPATPRHRWIRATHRADRAAVVAALDLPPLLMDPVDAHRRLGGPYTAAGRVVTEVVPKMLADLPDLVQRRDIEIHSVAPDLRDAVPATRSTLTSLAVPEERTRFYSRVRTLRIANGLCELVRDYAHYRGDGHTLLVEGVDHADPTDAEWLAVLLRRLDPRILTLVICTSGEPPSELLADALHSYCDVVTGECVPLGQDGAEPAALAAAFIAGDCVDDDPAVLAAYEGLDPAERARMHDARADELEQAGQFVHRLGPIPHHRERGSDPAALAPEALVTPMNHAMLLGFYDATIEYAYRGRAVVDVETQEYYWWVFTSKITVSQAALGRPEEAELLYDEARATSVDPKIHVGAAYATAMLYTRYFGVDKKNHQRAKMWINQAIAYSTVYTDPEQRAIQTVFNQNGLALIEGHLKNLPEAYKLVSEGLARLDRELPEDRHRLHRSVLLHNRAQVLVGLGRLDEALADFTAVIAADPNYPEYYLDRGNLLRQLGRDDDALADYETAILLGPPFPELQYNRADVLLAAGDIESGLAGLSYVIELDPTFIDAYVNRAGLYVALGDFEAAAADAAAGLALEPDNAHLNSVRGQVHAEKGEFDEALAAYDAALAQDGTLQSAWAGRAAAAFGRGDLDVAVENLTRALELGDDAAIRFNRATAYQAVDRRAEAVADLRRALELDPDDPDTADLLSQLSAA